MCKWAGVALVRRASPYAKDPNPTLVVPERAVGIANTEPHLVSNLRDLEWTEGAQECRGLGTVEERISGFDAEEERILRSSLEAWYVEYRMVRAWQTIEHDHRDSGSKSGQ